MPEIQTQQIPINAFLIGAMEIFVSLIMILLGWLPAWVLFGSLIVGAVLYGTYFFSIGTTVAFSAGVFAALNWLPYLWYWSGLVIAALFLAAKVADRYVNTGVQK